MREILNFIAVMKPGAEPGVFTSYSVFLENIRNFSSIYM